MGMLAPELLDQMVNTFVRSAANQFGLVNVYSQNTKEPATEATIVQDVASYGKQLGRILDVLVVLLAHHGIADTREDVNGGMRDFTEDEVRVIRDFFAMVREIEEAKNRVNPTRAVVKQLKLMNQRNGRARNAKHRLEPR